MNEWKPSEMTRRYPVSAAIPMNDETKVVAVHIQLMMF